MAPKNKNPRAQLSGTGVCGFDMENRVQTLTGPSGVHGFGRVAAANLGHGIPH